MNKKVLSLGVMLSLATTGAMAADVVTTSVNNGDQLSKYQKEAIQLTQKQLAEKSMVGLLKKQAVTLAVVNLVVITSPLVLLYLILNSMQVLILHVILVKALALAMKKHCNKQNMMLLVATIH